MNEQDKYDWMVCARCFTYNHASYIVDAMNGFTMQNTTFPYVCCIVDDASTDGEQDIIRQYLADYFEAPYRTDETEYAHIFCANHATNPNCTFVVLLLKYNHYRIKKTKMPYLSEWMDNSRYHAICEGDDYWNYSRKTQMQVDYLTSHPEVGLVYSEIDRYMQLKNVFEKEFFKTMPIKNTHEDFLLNSWFLAPCTWLYRSELARLYPLLDKTKCFMGDTLWILTYSKYTQVHFINEVTAVYRVLQTSASHFDDYDRQRKFWRKNLNTRMFFLQDMPFFFRLKFWWKVFRNGRPSFRTQKDILPEWLCDGFEDFFRILFIKKTTQALISK